MSTTAERAEHVRKGLMLPSIRYELNELARQLGIDSVYDLSDDDLVALWELRRSRFAPRASE